MENNIKDIWEEFSDALRSFVLKRVRNEALADDIIQEVFIKVIENIDNLRSKDKIQPWLYQITRNTIVDHFRRQQAETSILNDLQDNMLEQENDAALAKDLTPCLHVLINRLPEKYKSALEMTEFEGLTQKEMGERLGMSVPGAKSRAQRARTKLKDLLLHCCSFELDGTGNVLDFQPKSPDAPECCHNHSDSQDPSDLK